MVFGVIQASCNEYSLDRQIASRAGYIDLTLL